MGCESFDVVGFDLGPSFNVKFRIPDLELVITCLLSVPEVCSVEPTYRKSWAVNLLMWSHLTFGTELPVKKFIQNQPLLKTLIKLLPAMLNKFFQWSLQFVT